MRAILLASLLLGFAGCASPDEDWPQGWKPPFGTAGYQRTPNATSFLVLDVGGYVGPQGGPPTGAVRFCHPRWNASIDVVNRTMVLPSGYVDQWRGNVTALVWSHVTTDRDGECSASILTPLGPTVPVETGTVTRLGIQASAVEEGLSLGGRLLAEGEPYHHQVRWQEVKPTDGEVIQMEANVIFTSRGVWEWTHVTSDGVLSADDASYLAVANPTVY